jgi:ABC-type phosphate transport system ATPase subunit
MKQHEIEKIKNNNEENPLTSVIMSNGCEKKKLLKNLPQTNETDQPPAVETRQIEATLQ